MLVNTRQRRTHTHGPVCTAVLGGRKVQQSMPQGVMLHGESRRMIIHKVPEDDDDDDDRIIYIPCRSVKVERREIVLRPGHDPPSTATVGIYLFPTRPLFDSRSMDTQWHYIHVFFFG